MPNISITVPNLVGGVSQQPDQLRFRSQCSVADNVHMTVSNGATKRPPAKHVKRLITETTALPPDRKLHLIDRNQDERYVCLLEDGGLRVWDTNGNSYIVVAAGGYAYMNVADINSLKALTVGDTTFVLNTEMVTAMESSLSPTDATLGHAFLYIRNGQPLTTYEINLKKSGSTTKTFVCKTLKASGATPGPNEIDSYKADLIAENLRGKIDADVDFVSATTDRLGTVVRITASAAIVQFDAWDGAGDTAMLAFNRVVDNFDDLPSICKDGYVVRVRGNVLEAEDDRYVKFVADVAGSLSEGVWEETLAPGIQYEIDADTMPHALTRTIDDAIGTVTGVPYGTYFTFGPVDWSDRLVGDPTTNPFPSFIGLTINEVFFHQHRLGFLAGNKVVLSGVNEYYNFWRTTVGQVLDNDPIDVSVQHSEGLDLLHAITFDERLVVSSAQTQFVLDGSPVLTPRTVSVSPKSNYSISPLVRPINKGLSIAFAVQTGGYTRLSEVFPDEETEKLTAFDLTQTVPKYIDGDPVSLTHSAQQNLVAVLPYAGGQNKKVYLYKYYLEDKERIQSAWSKIEMTGLLHIVGVAFAENVLYFVIWRTDGTYLERINFGDGLVDSDSSFVICLDRRINEADFILRTYNAGTNRTEITLPYDIEAGEIGNMRVVSRAATAPAQRAGTDYPIVASNLTVSGSHKVYVSGNQTAARVWFGKAYTMTFEFSRPQLKNITNREAQVQTVDGRWQMLYGILSYEHSAYFRSSVTAEGREAVEKEYISPLANGLEPDTGRFSFPIMAKNTEVTIQLINDSPLPSNFIDAEWVGRFTSRSKKRVA